MALSNYTELQAAIASYLNRADLTATIPDFIKLAEATLNKVVRNTRMVGTASVAVSTRNADVPADFLEPLYVQLTSDEDYPLTQVSAGQIGELRQARTRAPGTPRFFAIVGRKIEVTPTPAAATGLTMQYYQELPPLASNATNWLLTYQPDLYLYTSLLHASPFLLEDARVELFGNLITQQVTALVQQNATATFEAAS